MTYGLARSRGRRRFVRGTLAAAGGAPVPRCATQARVIPWARSGTDVANVLRVHRRGQATVELALMIPLIFAVLFFVVQFAFFLGDTHYVNYAAFAGARAQQVGGDGQGAAEMLLDGNATRLATVSAGGESVSVSQPWSLDLPFTDTFGDLDFDVTVVAGPDEERYEGTSGRLPQLYADNNCRGGC